MLLNRLPRVWTEPLRFGGMGDGQERGAFLRTWCFCCKRPFFDLDLTTVCFNRHTHTHTHTVRMSQLAGGTSSLDHCGCASNTATGFEWHCCGTLSVAGKLVSIQHQWRYGLRRKIQPAVIAARLLVSDAAQFRVGPRPLPIHLVAVSASSRGSVPDAASR